MRYYRRYRALCNYYLAERRAHAHQLAGRHISHMVNVVVTENHRKEPASWGCMSRLVGFFLI
jgi:hypothetical protein